MSTAPARAEGWLPGSLGLNLSGYLEGRLIKADDTLSWENGGLGKTRYGGHNASGSGFLLKGYGALVVEPKFGFDWTGRVVLSVADDQHTPVTINEAFIQYKPAPTSNFGFKARAGFFYPPISLENTGIGWTSPYTLTPSAINTWVGEELRTIGPEATVYYKNENWEVDLTGAAFLFNDPAGTQLAWRGWTFSDHQFGFFDRLTVPSIPILRPPSRLADQARTENPYDEIDDRWGTYAAAVVGSDDYGKLTALWYDNNADDHQFERGQWAWRTHFWSFGYTADLPWDVHLIAQYMSGSTSILTVPVIEAVDYTDFKSYYGLISKDWGPHRLSLRFDHFKNHSERQAFDNTDEHGNAITAAYVFRPSANQRITLEVLHVDSNRGARGYWAWPLRAQETQVQISYRFFFSLGP
ncbi:MAG: hypothetical protein ACXWLZ_08975 [Rhizomicrobium sp.]